MSKKNAPEPEVVEVEEDDAIVLDFSAGSTDHWQLYRSKTMFRAMPVDHDFTIAAGDDGEALSGQAGDFVCVDKHGGFFVMSPELMAAYQPIADSERAKD